MPQPNIAKKALVTDEPKAMCLAMERTLNDAGCFAVSVTARHPSLGDSRSRNSKRGPVAAKRSLMSSNYGRL